MVRQKATKRDNEARDVGVERGQSKDKLTSVRLSPGSKAAAEWVARARGLSLNQVYSHAIALLAEDTRWRDFSFDDVYHPSEGAYWCNLMLAGLQTDGADAYRAEFIAAHKPFFFYKAGREWKPDEQKIGALWGHVDYLADHWNRRREMDAWATGEKMQGMLKEAKIVPPAWGPKAEIER
jgi:hypothetical protein